MTRKLLILVVACFSSGAMACGCSCLCFWWPSRLEAFCRARHLTEDGDVPTDCFQEYGKYNLGSPEKLFLPGSIQHAPIELSPISQDSFLGDSEGRRLTFDFVNEKTPLLAKKQTDKQVSDV